jgi:hypothetical protein
MLLFAGTVAARIQENYPKHRAGTLDYSLLPDAFALSGQDRDLPSGQTISQEELEARHRKKSLG